MNFALNNVINYNFYSGNDLEHEGEDCWDHCDGKQGPCSWCGLEGMCCSMRPGYVGNGCDGTFGGDPNHVCKLKPGKIYPSPIGIIFNSIYIEYLCANNAFLFQATAERNGIMVSMH